MTAYDLAVQAHPISGAEVPSDYLGPAVVLAVEATSVLVEIPEGGAARAEIALAYPYRPAVGDVLLVVGRVTAKRSAHYVIGVLHGTGKAVLTFPSDVEIVSESGKLTLEGALGVTVRGPEVEVTSHKLTMMAGAIVHKCETLYQRVRKLFAVNAGEAQTIVEGESMTRARSSTLLTEEKVLINGKQIHLG